MFWLIRKDDESSAAGPFLMEGARRYADRTGGRDAYLLVRETAWTPGE